MITVALLLPLWRSVNALEHGRKDTTVSVGIAGNVLRTERPTDGHAKISGHGSSLMHLNSSAIDSSRSFEDPTAQNYDLYGRIPVPVFSMEQTLSCTGGCEQKNEGAAADLPLRNDKYTVEVTFQTNAQPVGGKNWYGLMGWGDWSKSSEANGFRFQMPRGGEQVLYHMWSQNDLAFSPDFRLNDNLWHQLIATYDGEMRKMYLDGELVAEDSRNDLKVASTSNFCLCQTGDTDAHGFTGKLRNVYIYKGYAKKLEELPLIGKQPVPKPNMWFKRMNWLSLRGMIATQSSTYNSTGYPENAIDGISVGNMLAKTCAIMGGTQPWWKLDLMSDYNIQKIVVTPPFTDQFAGKLNSATISVKVSGTYETCGTINKLDMRVSSEFDCVKTGRLIKIAGIDMATSEPSMAICEIQVFVCEGGATGDACPTDKPTWLDLRSKITYQSSTNAMTSGVARLAVDQITETNFANGSCTRTNPEKNPWWSVDLKGTHEISGVRITTRESGDDLSKALLRIGNDTCAEIGKIDGGNTREYKCAGTGKSVSITLPYDGTEERILTLCEVGILGKNKGCADWSGLYNMKDAGKTSAGVVSITEAGCDLNITNTVQGWANASGNCTEKELTIIGDEYTGSSRGFAFTSYGMAMVSFKDGGKFMRVACDDFTGDWWDEATQTSNLKINQTACNVTATNPDALWGVAHGNITGGAIFLNFPLPQKNEDGETAYKTMRGRLDETLLLINWPVNEMMADATSWRRTGGLPSLSSSSSLLEGT